MSVTADAVIQLFERAFFADYHTVLLGGADEPLYVPSDQPEQNPHRLYFRADFVRSALHEVAHWCVAGPRRRTRVDFGYSYTPDGRTAAEQEQFERFEARPQALECLFCQAIGQAFEPSADNLAGGNGPSQVFHHLIAKEMCVELPTPQMEAALYGRNGRKDLVKDCDQTQPRWLPDRLLAGKCGDLPFAKMRMFRARRFAQGLAKLES